LCHYFITLDATAIAERESEHERKHRNLGAALSPTWDSR